MPTSVTWPAWTPAAPTPAIPIRVSPAPLSHDPGSTGGGQAYDSYSNVHWGSQSRGHNCVTLNDENYTLTNQRPVMLTWEDGGNGDAEFAASVPVYADPGGTAASQRGHLIGSTLTIYLPRVTIF